jgi:hypothetical protein
MSQNENILFFVKVYEKVIYCLSIKFHVVDNGEEKLFIFKVIIKDKVLQHLLGTKGKKCFISEQVLNEV